MPQRRRKECANVYLTLYNRSNKNIDTENITKAPKWSGLKYNCLDVCNSNVLPVGLLEDSVNFCLCRILCTVHIYSLQEYELAFTHGYNRYLVFSGYGGQSLQEVFSQISVKEEAALVVSVCTCVCVSVCVNSVQNPTAANVVADTSCHWSRDVPVLSGSDQRRGFNGGSV